MANLNGYLQGLGANPELDLDGLTDSEIAALSERIDSEFSGHPALGRIRKNVTKQLQRRVLKRKATHSAHNIEPGRDVFVNRIKDIKDPGIVRQIENGDLAVSDFLVYSQKVATSRTEMFLPKDKQERGVSNINAGKMNTNTAFLVKSIIVLGGINGDVANDPNGLNVTFEPIHTSIANGNFTFKNGQKTFMEDASMSGFAHSGSSTLLPGEMKLEFAKMIDSRSEIAFNIDAAGTIPANYHLKVILKGSSTVKA